MVPNQPTRKRNFNPKEMKDLMEHLGLLTHLGLTMVAAVGIGFALGYYLDQWTGHRGLWKALFIPLGALSGFWAVYRIVTETGRRAERRQR
ncbi:MAG: AtpZ/AtpI family protein [Deferrisomatales bacterium]|nr:AtpZ/AtpI family protein [Deferrisomatales bacterium]